MSSRLNNRTERIIKTSKKFWQPVSVIDEEGLIVDFAALLDSTKIEDEDGNFINEQNPFPIKDENTLVYSDLSINTSVQYNFDTLPVSGGDVFFALFSDKFQTIQDNTGNSLKELYIDFKRSVVTNLIGLGATGGTFSNVKVWGRLSGGTEIVLVDDSLNNDLKTTETYIFSVVTEQQQLTQVIGINGIRLQFLTTNVVTLSNFYLPKIEIGLSLIQGITPSGQSVFFRATDLGNFVVSLDEQKDEFGRVKTSEPFTIADNTLVSEYALVHYWGDIGTGTLTYDKATSKVLMTVAQGQWHINQTRQRYGYQPGKSHEVLHTWVMEKVPGVLKRVGLLDYDNYNAPVINFDTPQNGVAILVDGVRDGVYFQIWNNGVLFEEEEQSNWNIDKLDGTGITGFNLDTSKAQIGLSGLEWLGVGRVRVGFNINGVNVPCHEFNHANNNISDVYMRTANLPVSYAIQGVTGSGEIKQICNSVISGGGYNPLGAQKFVYNTTNVAINNGDTELLIGIRLKEGSFDIAVFQESLSIFSTSRNDFFVGLVMNPSYTGTVTWIDKPNSSVQYALNNNNQVTDLGLDLYGDLVSGNVNSISPDFDTTLRLGKSLDGTYDEIWLIAEAIGGNDNFRGLINFRDLI